MQSIGIGEIQKNTSVFTNMTETIQIIDKRKKQVLAMVYPVKRASIKTEFKRVISHLKRSKRFQ